MLVSSSSASGIKTCLYKGFLTAEGTKCSPERKEPESLHLPSTPALQRNNASQRSWKLALGRWQKQHCSSHKRRKRELSALGSSVIILPTISRKRKDCPINQLSWASGSQRLLLPSAISTFAPVASGPADTQLPTSSPWFLVHSKCVYSPFVDCLQWLPTCQEGTGRMVRKGREMGGQSWKKRGRRCVSCTWRAWWGIEVKLNLGSWVLLFMLTLR